jgi:curved DNA-binding protein CbpA
MPPRPLSLLRPLARHTPPWICNSCLHRTSTARQAAPPRIALFHSTSPNRADNPPNHYETLELPHTATAVEIKRQFYTLSKKNHPDHNRDDPTASTRFVAISEAYHTLGVPEKRAQYDAQLHQSERRSGWGRGNAQPQGSYSSAAYGSRPASGLNKKRSTFRGPPPSFYKSGGYGEHGAKRAEYAHHDPTGGKDTREAPDESYGDYGGGYGPGQQKQGHQVPHFNDRRHKETHDSVNDHIWARRRRAQRAVHTDEEYERGDMLLNFVMVTGVIGIVGASAHFFGNRSEAKESRRKGEL